VSAIKIKGSEYLMFGGYGIDANVKLDDKQVRDKLAITTEFKDLGDLQYESIFRVKAEMPSNRGPIGPQYDRDGNFTLYPGSDDIEQIEISKNVRPQDRGNYLERVGELRELNVNE